MKYLLLVFLFFLSMAFEKAPEEPATIETLGKWGGNGVKMTVNEKETLVEFDCAHALISSKLNPVGKTIPDHKGTFIFEKGGPILIDEKPIVHPANFKGAIEGDVMELTITILDQKQADLKFILNKNSAGKLTKCL